MTSRCSLAWPMSCADRAHPQPPFEALIAARSVFSRSRSRETRSSKGQLADVRHGGLVLESLCHARESEFVKQVESGSAKHDRQDSLSSWGGVV